jgi:polyhydroxybutyrate depolymerase
VATGGSNTAGGAAPGTGGSKASGSGGAATVTGGNAGGGGTAGGVSPSSGSNAGGGTGANAGAAGAAAGAGGATPSTGCGVTNSLKSGRTTISVSGAMREYVLRIPDGYDAKRPYKLIFAFHARGGNAEQVTGSGNDDYYGLYS